MPINAWSKQRELNEGTTPSLDPLVQVGGYHFPADPGQTPEQRIEALEYAVRALYANAVYLLEQVERLDRQANPP